jgi:hypothetical protein
MVTWREVPVHHLLYQLQPLLHVALGFDRILDQQPVHVAHC